MSRIDMHGKLELSKSTVHVCMYAKTSTLLFILLPFFYVNINIKMISAKIKMQIKSGHGSCQRAETGFLGKMIVIKL